MAAIVEPLGDRRVQAQQPMAINSSVQQQQQSYVQHQQPMYAANQQAGADVPNTVIFLRPIAPPSGLGMAAYFGGVWVLSTWLTGWWGHNNSVGVFWPFVFTFGGITQLLCGHQGFNARDIYATIFHSTWGTILMAWSFFAFFGSIGAFNIGDVWGHQEELATWYLVVCIIMFACIIPSFARDLIFFMVTLLSFIGTLLLTIGYYNNTFGCIRAGGYVLMVSSLFALYRTLAYLVWENIGPIIPIFRTPFELAAPLVKIPIGEPGIKKGQ